MKIIVSQKDIDENTDFYLYNAIYSDGIKWNNNGKFQVIDIFNYFSEKGLFISVEKIKNFIDDSIEKGLAYKRFSGYGLLPR